MEAVRIPNIRHREHIKQFKKKERKKARKANYSLNFKVSELLRHCHKNTCKSTHTKRKTVLTETDMIAK